MLRRPKLRQVAQRFVARYHLTHLTRLEVGAPQTQYAAGSEITAPIA